MGGLGHIGETPNATEADFLYNSSTYELYYVYISNFPRIIL